MMQSMVIYCILFTAFVSAMEKAIISQPSHLISREVLGENFVELIQSSVCAQQKQVIAEQLLQLNADPNYDKGGYPLLHLSLWQANTFGVIRLLIESRADSSAYDCEKKTPFYYALNHSSVTDAIRVIRCRYLMGFFDAKDVPVIQNLPSSKNQLQDASSPSSGQLYLNNGLYSIIRSPRDLEVKKELIAFIIKQGAQINGLYFALTPIQHALQYSGKDGYDIAKFLLDMNADPSVYDGLRRSAIFYAIDGSAATDSNCVERVKLLFSDDQSKEKR